MISKSFEKYVKSLTHKKYRSAHHRFIAEGEKTVQEFLNEGFPAEKILALPAWTEKHERWIKNYEVTEISVQQMEKLSMLVTPSPVMFIGMSPEHDVPSAGISSQVSLVLDDIADPGNLGTIIRIADWFDIEYVFCSPNCAEVWNPKTVQASMGSLARIKVIETGLDVLFQQNGNVPVYGAFTSGSSVYDHPQLNSGFILIGSEAHGISTALHSFISERITIPKSGKAESLNAAVATGILCALLLRK